MNADLRLRNGVYKGVVGALVAFGCVCIAAGGAIALYAGWVVYLLIEDPKRIALVSHLVDLGGKRLEAVRGSIDGRAFSIELGACLLAGSVADRGAASRRRRRRGQDPNLGGTRALRDIFEKIRIARVRVGSKLADEWN